MRVVTQIRRLRRDDPDPPALPGCGREVIDDEASSSDPTRISRLNTTTYGVHRTAR